MGESIGSPQSVYNGAVSGQRNMFLSSSLAVVIAGFSNNFKNKNITLFVQLLSVLIFAISVYIGISTNYDFTFYLDRVKHKLPSYIPIDNWYRMGNVMYLYTFIIILIGAIFLFRKVL